MDWETEIRQEIAAELHYPVGKIRNSTRFKRDLKCFDFELTALLMRLEKKYRIRLKEGEAPHSFVTVENLISEVLSVREKTEENYESEKI